MMRFAMTAAGILLGLFSVILLMRPLAPSIELGILASRFAVYALLLLVMYCVIDHSDKDVTGSSFALAPFAGPSAAGIVGSSFLNVLGIPVLFLIAVAVWFKIISGTFQVIGTRSEFREEAIVWQLSGLARLAFYSSMLALLAIAGNLIILAGTPSPGVF